MQVLNSKTVFLKIMRSLHQRGQADGSSYVDFSRDTLDQVPYPHVQKDAG